MVNTNLETGIRFGIISARSLDPELVCDLQDRGVDLYYQNYSDEVRAELERDADAIEEEVAIAIAETDYSLVGNEEWEERSIEAAYVRLGYSGREDYIETRHESLMHQYQCDEPTHAGEYEGVKYQTTWLGGALLVWIFESPVISRARLCSPCVPNALDLDNLDPNGEEGYGVPDDWRNK